MTQFLGRIREDQTKALVKEADKRFIYALIEDSRRPLTTLAKTLRISKDTAHYTLSKLQEHNIITHLAPIVDLTFFGYQTYHAFFVTNDENKKRKKEFIDFLINHKHTKSLMEYTSRWEVEWTVVATNIQAFDALLTDITTQFSDVILEKTKIALIRGYKSTTVALRNPEQQTYPKQMKKHTLKHYTPDDIDKRIIAHLHDDARVSSYTIGESLSLSSNAIRYRIKKLIDTGIIRSFTATVNLNALGYHLYTVGIILKSLSSTQEAKLKEFLRGQRFIIRAVKVLGPWDVMLTILADNIKHYHSTVKEIEDMFSDIIISYDTLIGYEEKVYKYVPDVVVET